jgi:hypothetical protein
MQIFIKLLDGKTITLDVQPFDLVEAVMEKITERIGTPYKYQRLIYKGKQLHPDRLLSDYGVQPEDTIHLVYRLLGAGVTIPITVKNIIGKEYLIVMSPRATVEDLKKEFMKLEGTWWELQQMMFRDELLDDHMALELYGIDTGAILRMIPKYKKCSCCSEGRV